MARTVTDTFKGLWQRKIGQKEILRVQYKLRYWTGSAFAYQSAWTTLDKGEEFLGVGRIPQQLDAERNNIIKRSIISLRFDNTQNQWIEMAGSPSFFASDSIASEGYRLARSQFRVQFGYILDDDTEEVINVFTGLATGKIHITGRGAEAVVEVSSKDLLLESADAEKVSQSATLEDCVPATGDGSNKSFESTSIGVDHSTDVQVDAVSQDEGSDYRVSNENQVAGGGNTGRLAITFETAPPNTETVKVSLVKWYQNQTVETLIGLLLDEAGIPSGERTIAPVVFAGGVGGSKTIDIQSEWQAGTVFTNTEADSLAGSLKRKWFLIDNFSDGDYTADPAWTVQSGSGSIVSGKLRLSGASSFSFFTGKAYGSWECNMYRSAGTASFHFYRWVGAIFGGGSGTNGYSLQIDGTNLRLYRHDHNSGGGGDVLTLLATVAWTPTSTDTYRVTRESDDGEFKVYANGTLKFTVTDNTHTNASKGYILLEGTSGDTDFDDIYWAELVIAGAEAASQANPIIYESQEFDLLAAPTAWGVLTAIYDLAGGSIAISTDVASVSGGPYDGYVALGAGNVIASALKQFLKIKLEITVGTNVGILTGPSVDKIVANFTTSSVFLALANFQGKKVSEAEQRLAELADYVRRFDGDGNYIFQSRDPSASFVVHLTQENGIIDVLGYDTGVPDRVRNVGRVRSGGFVKSYDKDSASEASPTSEAEYGRRVQEDNFDDVMLANDADIRTARARAIYERLFRPPLRIRLRIWMVPWLEVTDIVRVSYYDNPLLKAAYMNDPLLSVTGAGFSLGEPGNVIARDRDFMAIDYVPDYDTNQAELLLEAV